MLLKKIIDYLEDWAPPGAAWEKDNPGLQVGDPETPLTNILLSLDTTEETVREAQQKNCNLIISHHPLIFHPLKKINTRTDAIARVIAALIKNNIALYSAHTNLDFTRGGVSFALAKKIGLTNTSFLKAGENNQCKIVVFVPHDHVAQVSEAMFSAGGGVIGEYTKCSCRVWGEGTFQGSANAHPAIGEKENFEKVVEARIEVIVSKWNVAEVVAAIRSVHPYEEPAIDIYPLHNADTNYGAGVLGELETALEANEFLRQVKEQLDADGLRYCAGASGAIKKVAVCGGAGGELLSTAVKCGADAFISADISYHTFRDAEGKILLIDAGHYETEAPVLDALSFTLNSFLQLNHSAATVLTTEHRDTPVKFF